MSTTPFANVSLVFASAGRFVCLLVGAIMAMSPSQGAAQAAPRVNPSSVLLTPDECTVEVELTGPTLGSFTVARVFDDSGRASRALSAALNARAGTLTLACAPSVQAGDYTIELATRTRQSVKLDLAVVVELPADEPPVIASVSAPEKVAPGLTSTVMQRTRMG